MVLHGARFVLGAGRLSVGRRRDSAGVFALPGDTCQIPFTVFIAAALLLIHRARELAVLVHHEAELAHADRLVVANDAFLELIAAVVGTRAGVFANAAPAAGVVLVAVVVCLACLDGVGDSRARRHVLLALGIGVTVLIGPASVAARTRASGTMKYCGAECIFAAGPA